MARRLLMLAAEEDEDSTAEAAEAGGALGVGGGSGGGAQEGVSPELLREHARRIHRLSLLLKTHLPAFLRLTRAVVEGKFAARDNPQPGKVQRGGETRACVCVYA